MTHTHAQACTHEGTLTDLFLFLFFVGSITDFPINWVHVEFPETIRTVTLDKTSAEYREVEKKFLNSVKNGIYNTGKAPNCKVNPVGQFNKVKVHEVIFSAVLFHLNFIVRWTTFLIKYFMSSLKII